MGRAHAQEVAALAPLSVVAVVQVNKEEALVLNRPLQFRYRKEGNDYIGRDGPFLDLLLYQRGGGRLKAFAGREITLAMEDGSTVVVKDHWWHSVREGYASIAYGDVGSLRKCYVFYGGACIAPDDLKALRETYTGCVYPYRDYEKVIKYDDQRADLHRRWFHEEDRRKALEKAIKAKDAELTTVREALSCLLRVAGDTVRSALPATDDRQQDVMAIPLETWRALADALPRGAGFRDG